MKNQIYFASIATILIFIFIYNTHDALCYFQQKSMILAFLLVVFASASYASNLKNKQLDWALIDQISSIRNSLTRKKNNNKFSQSSYDGISKHCENCKEKYIEIASLKKMLASTQEKLYFCQKSVASLKESLASSVEQNDFFFKELSEIFQQQNENFPFKDKFIKEIRDLERIIIILDNEVAEKNTELLALQKQNTIVVQKLSNLNAKIDIESFNNEKIN